MQRTKYNLTQLRPPRWSGLIHFYLFSSIFPLCFILLPLFCFFLTFFYKLVCYAPTHFFSSLTSHKSHSLEGLHNANKSTTPSIKHQAISHTSTGQAPAIPTTLSLFRTSTSSLCHPDFAYLFFFFWLLYFLLVHTFCSFLLPSLNFTHILTPLQTATTQGTTFLQSSFYFFLLSLRLSYLFFPGSLWNGCAPLLRTHIQSFQLFFISLFFLRRSLDFNFRQHQNNAAVLEGCCCVL